MSHFIPYNFGMPEAPLKLNLISFTKQSLNFMSILNDVAENTLTTLLSGFLKSL